MTEDRLLGWLEALMARPSPTGVEGYIQGFLASVLREMGFEVILDPVLPGRPNLYALRGKPRYVVATHVDTVPVWGHRAGSGLAARDGVAYGRGVVDPKGQIAALLTALEVTSAPAFVALFVDEEKGGKGSEAFRNPWGGKVEGALVLEPTGFQICNFQLGSVEFEADVPGREAHGATYEEDRNAVLRCMDLIRDLRGLSFLGGWGITIGRIEGGKDCQVLPDSCRFTADIPIPWGIRPENALNEVLETLDRYGARYAVLSVDEPVHTPPEASIVQDLSGAAAEVLGRPPHFGVMSAWTDAANLSSKGIPSVVFGAGTLALCHTGDERIPLSELLTLSRVIRSFLERAG